MNCFRLWSHSAWLLHGYLLVVLSLPPFPMTRAYWADADGDGAYNDEGLAYGSDPFDYDTDDDGLNDGDEIHIAIQQAGKAYSLTNWDSNGDCVSDFDDFYGCFSVTYPGGQLPSFDGPHIPTTTPTASKTPLTPIQPTQTTTTLIMTALTQRRSCSW